MQSKKIQNVLEIVVVQSSTTHWPLPPTGEWALEA